MKVKDIIKEMEAPIQGKFGPGTIAGKKAEIVQPNGITTTVDLTNPENAAKFKPNAAGQLQFDQDPDPGTMGVPPAQSAGQTAPVAPITPGAPVNVISDEQAIGEEQHTDAGGDGTDQYIKQIEIPRDDDLDEDPELNRIKHLSGMANEQMGTPENETPEEVIARMKRDTEAMMSHFQQKHLKPQESEYWVQKPKAIIPVAPLDKKAPEPVAPPDRKAPAPAPVAPPDRKAPVANPKTLELLKKL